MKNFILLIGLVLFVSNILIGLVATSYDTFNICLNSVVIFLTTALLVIVQTIDLRDAFRISMSLFVCALGAMEYCFGFFATERLTDNWYLIMIIIFMVFKSVLLLLAYYTTKSNK